jgi:hypothetical protein
MLGYFWWNANNPAFTTINPNAFVPGASDAFLYQMVAGGTRVYITLAYNDCSSSSGCTAVVASADGGKTWTSIAHTLNFRVVWVAGSTLYGEVIGPETVAPAIQTSTDNGASWQPLRLPYLPDASTVGFAFPSQLLADADGTIFVVDRIGTVAYLRSGGWTVLPILSGDTGDPGIRGDRGPLGSVTFGQGGHPMRVWVFSRFVTDTGYTGSSTPYRHDVQIV